VNVAALAHAGVGLAAKRLAPSAPWGVLLLGAYVLDLVWAAFWLMGLDHFPAPGLVVPAPWSHGLTMAIVWSVAAGGAAFLITRERRSGLFFGALAFSHWIVDFITQPMGAAFPGAGFRVQVFPGASATIEGFGLYNSAVLLNVVEYGTLVAGVAVYVLTIRGRTPARRSRPGRHVAG
jgi:hypothetical protein